MQKEKNGFTQKKRKGFTLIEILGAIVILGILSAVAVIAVNRIIKEGKNKHYETAEKNLMLAGQSYFQDNRSELPKVIGQKKKIYLSTLKEKNYIKEILDYNDNSCNVNESYVQIYKYSQDDYSYLAYLECQSYKSEIKSETYKPFVEITFTGKEEANAEATITIKDNNKLVSYNYIVYKGTKEMKNSGSIAVSNYAKEITKKVDLSSYTPGKIKVVAVATNIYGNTYTAATEFTYEDKKEPICKYIDPADNPDNPKEWANGTRKITVGCQDEAGSGCTRETFSKTFKETTKIGTIKISDEAGNTYDCPVSVYLDNTAPTITVDVYKRTSSGSKTGNVLTTETVNNSNKTETLDLSKLSSTEWLNKTEYPNGLYYEVKFSDDQALEIYRINQNTAGLSTSTIEEATTSIINKISTGKSTSTTFDTTDDGYRTYALTSTDEAGNIVTLNIITPLDRESPSIPTVRLYQWKNNSTKPTSSSDLVTYTNDTWSKLNVYTTASDSTDAISGVGKYQYTTTGKTTNDTNKTSSDLSIETEGISYIQYRACDIAGNCSDNSTKSTIKIDKENPVCTVSGGSTTWTNETRTITAKCSDSGSGCATEDFSKTYNTEISTTTAGAVGDNNGGIIYDVAGNSTTCAANQTVRIDRTSPTCQVSGGSNSWTNGSRTITATCSDSGSGCDKENISKTYSTNINTTTAGAVGDNNGGTIYDKAGNSTTCAANQTVKIDKTNPTITSINNPSGGNAVAPGLVLTLYGSDAGGSGISHWRYSYNGSSWNNYSSSDYSGYQTTPFTTVRNQDVYIGLCDVAGNCVSDTTYIHIIDPCSSTWTDWGSWSSCSVSCGTGTKERSGTKYSNYDNSYCGIDYDSKSCDAGPCEPVYAPNNCKIRGSSKKTQGYTWDCTCGRTHSTGYTHYCTDSSGKLWTREENKSLVAFSWVCPISPYGEAEGWTIIPD